MGRDGKGKGMAQGVDSVVTISKHTAAVALKALLHLEMGPRDWARMPDEEAARAAQATIRNAIEEIKGAVNG
jgi:hypothetical protein